LKATTFSTASRKLVLSRLLYAAMSAVTASGVAAPAAAQSTAAPITQDKATGPSTRIIVFGDSISDGGFFAALGAVPLEASRFTTNPDLVSVEVLAQRLGLPLRSFYGQNGTNFAVGGARVDVANFGGLVPSITGQVDAYLTSNRVFAPTDTIVIQGGGNDVVAAVLSTAFGLPDAASILPNAASQLAGQVTRLQSAGAQRIVTLSLPSFGNPFSQQLNASYRAALSTANVNALYVDADKLFTEVLANPRAFGIQNVTGTACIDGALGCTRATLVGPGANETYLFADNLHLTGAATRLQGNLAASLLTAPAQIANLSYAAQSGFRVQRDLLALPMQVGVGEKPALFSSIGYQYADRNGNVQQPGFSERGVFRTLGVDLPLGGNAGIGIAGAYGEGNGDLAGTGGYDGRYYSGTVYGRVARGPLRIAASGTYGRVNYDNLSRTVVLGPAVRRTDGDTSGTYVAGRLGMGLAIATIGTIEVGPEGSVDYERIRIAGYTERGTLSSDAGFGRQQMTSLTGRIGMLAQSRPGSPVRLAARVNYVKDFKDDPRSLTVTPAGAPVSYTTGVARADRDYATGGLNAEGDLTGMLTVRAGMAAEVGRRDMQRIVAHAGISLKM